MVFLFGFSILCYLWGVWVSVPFLVFIFVFFFLEHPVYGPVEVLGHIVFLCEYYNLAQGKGKF